LKWTQLKTNNTVDRANLKKKHPLACNKQNEQTKQKSDVKVYKHSSPENEV